MPNTRSNSPSPAPERPVQTSSKKKGKQQGNQSKKTADKTPSPQNDAEDRNENVETDDSSAGSAAHVDKRLESLEKSQAAILKMRQDLDAEEARNRVLAEHLLAYPSGDVPRSLPTAAAGPVSSGSVALSAAERVDPDAARLRQDERTVAAARAAREQRVRTLFNISPVASRRPRTRDELRDDDVREVVPKRVRFADRDSDDDDEDGGALAVVPGGGARLGYLKNTAEFLLFLTNSTLSPSSTLLPSSLSSSLTLVYSAALTDIRHRVLSTLGAQQPTFAEFLFIMNAAQQYAPSLFPNNPNRGRLAVAALAAWHTQLTNVLTDMMKLANDSQKFVDGNFPLFFLQLRDADPSTFDPVAVAKALFSDVTVKLVSKRQKEVMNLAFPGGQSLQYQSQQYQSQQYQSGGKGSGGKGWGNGGKGKGGKGSSSPPPPGMPGQTWSDQYWMYIRFAYDSAGQKNRKACFKCGCGSSPNSTSSHHARDCKADSAVVRDWVQFSKPAQ